MDQELVQYLDQRFGRVDHRFDRIEQRLDGHDQRFNGMDQRFERLEERTRHYGLLIENVHHELRLVAENITMHREVMHPQEHEYHDRQHEETRSLIRSVYEDMKQRDEELRRRVLKLEQRKR